MISQTDSKATVLSALKQISGEPAAAPASSGGAAEAFLNLFRDMVNGNSARALTSFSNSSSIGPSRIEVAERKELAAPAPKEELVRKPVEERVTAEGEVAHEQELIVSNEEVPVEEQVVEVVAAPVAQVAPQQVEVAKPVVEAVVQTEAAVAAEVSTAVQAATVQTDVPVDTNQAAQLAGSMQKAEKPAAATAEKSVVTQQAATVAAKNAETESTEALPAVEGNSDSAMNLQKQMVGDGQDSTAKQGAKREAHDARSVVNAPVAEFGPKAERLPEISAREAAKPVSIQAAPVAAAVQTAVAPKAAEAAASDRNGFSAIQAAAAKSVVRDNGAAGMFGQVEKKAVNAKDSGSLGRAAKANQAKMIEQIQKAFESALQSKDGNTLTIKIDPVELGAMTVKVTKRAEQIFARVTAESPEVQEVLRSNVQEVVQALAAAGFKLHNVHVTIGNEILETESFQYQGFSEQYVQDERSNHSGSHSAGHDGEHDLPSSASQDGDAADAQAGWVA